MTTAQSEIKNVTYPFILNKLSKPGLVISGNKFTDVTFENILLSAGATSDFTLNNLGLDYLIHTDYGGHLGVGSGATLTISSGVKLLLDRKSVWVGGTLNADGVEFIGTTEVLNESVVFLSGSSGSLTNCLLDDVDVDISGGEPSISSCHFKNLRVPFFMTPGANPSISGNSFTGVSHEKICLNGYVKEDCVLKKMDFDYTMDVGISFNLTVYMDATLTIEPKVVIDRPSIYIGASNVSGNLQADSVSFNSGSVYFRANSGGLITNSRFNYSNAVIKGGNPVFSGCTFIAAYPGYAMNNSGSPNTIAAKGNYWGNPTGPRHSSNPGGLGSKVSDKIDFNPWLLLDPLVENERPVAIFTVSPDSGEVTTIFAFDAAESYDKEDSLTGVQIRWDYESDGTYDTEWSETRTVTHQFTETGTYSVTLQVKDTEGNKDTETERIYVLEPVIDNTPPGASFTILPESGSASTEFQFDASASSDNEDAVSALKFSWDFDSDGTWEVTDSSSPNASHTYSAAGTYIVVLKVTDTGGLIGETSYTLMLGDITFNEFRVIHETATDSLKIKFAICNNGSTALKNIRYRAYIGDVSNLMQLESTDPIPEILPGRRTAVAPVGYVGHNAENQVVTVEIYEINGAAASISAVDTFSVYYVRNMNPGKNARAYDLSKDAYTFPNSGLSYKEWSTWFWTFWDKDALSAFGMAIKGIGGKYEGRCHGYAATSNRYFMYENEKPVNKETGVMELSNPDVSDLISRFFIRQHYEPKRDNETDMLQAVNKLKFRFGTDEPVMIMFTDHTISAYKLVVRENKQNAFLYMYDNNKPKTVCVGTMKWGNVHSFFYDGYKEFAWQMSVAPPTDFDMKNMFSSLFDHIVGSLWEGSKILAGAASPVRVWVKDKYGRVSGYPVDSSVQVNEIPNTEVVRMYNPGADSLTYFYLPNNLSYTTHIAATDTGSMDFSLLVPTSETTTKSSYFKDVPLTSTEWIAEITVNDTVISPLNVDADGDGSVDDIVTSVDDPWKNTDGNGSGKSPVPDGFKLHQNYPNPFNPSTTISFEIPKMTSVTITVINILGQHVKTLIRDIPHTPGIYALQWNGTDKSGSSVASGIYIYRLVTSDGNVFMRKMILLK